jgi:group I intron endonuclease
MSSNDIYSIYLITNLVNQKKYVGWTSRDPQTRFHEHMTWRPKDKDPSVIAKSVDKHGADNFTLEVIYQSKDEAHSHDMEPFFITEHNSMVTNMGGWGYNIDFGEFGHRGGKRSQETIEKHRQKISGRPQSEEHKKKKGFKKGNTIGRGNKGKKRTEEQNKANSESKKQQYASGKIIPPLKNRSFKTEYPESIEQMKRTKLKNRIKNNKYKNIVVQRLDEPQIHLDEHYTEFFKEHQLNNFITLSIKYPNRIIKGWKLISYELNI